MFRKFLVSFISLGMILQASAPAFAAPFITMAQVYNYATRRDVNALKNVKSNLEVLDGRGNTAVCQAILNKDVRAYKTLLQAGANANAFCVNNIPQTEYKDFLASVSKVGTAGGDVATTGAAAGTATSAGSATAAGTAAAGTTVAGATAASTGTFLGMGVVGWGVTGAVVAGGAVAAAAGGGGGGGGSSDAPVDLCANIACGTNAYCSAGSCVCNSGYEGDADDACTLIILDCHNGIQSGTQCTCSEGWTGDFCDTPTVCPYSTTSCGEGYTATGNTCKSGNTTYTECAVNDCSAYQLSCGDGYDATQSCLSGTTPYYTCTAKEVPAGYQQATCGAGYDTTDTFLSGEITYYQCTAKEVPAGYQQAECGAGYDTTDTFLSGETTYYQCTEKDCSAYELSCGDGYDATQSCLSGTTPYYTCTAKEVPAGYQQATCGAGYDTTDTFLSGETTYYQCTMKDCSAYQASCGSGYDATQSCLSGETPYYTCTAKQVPTGYQAETCGAGYDTTDTFLSGETTYYQCAMKDCSTYQLSCAAGYDATQSCLSGETPYYTCTAKEVPAGYQQAECGAGYDTTDTFLSGETTYYQCAMKNCSAYETSCGIGYDATQSCLSGTTPYYTCTPKDVPAGYTIAPCTGGYEQDGITFVSGETNYYKCKTIDCSAYQLSCGVGYDATQSCLSGETPYYTCTPKDVPAGYTTSPCTGGYEQDGATFISGETNYYKCKEKDCSAYPYVSCPENAQSCTSCISGNNAPTYKATSCKTGWIGDNCNTPADCSAYQASCGAGYDATQSCLSGETPYYTCTAKEVPAGYQQAECGAGYDTTDTFLSGETTYYLCEIKICDSQYKLSCADGYHLSETDTCKSGENTLAVCEINVCDENYKSSCDEGYHLSTTDVCQTGETKLALCEANTCIGYTLKEIPTNCMVSDSCKTPTETMYKCNTCNEGYKGNECSTCANGYGKDSNGLCVIKQADVVGTNVNNTSYADVYGTKTSDNNGTIELTNKSDGNVYGTYSANNAYAETTESASAVIEAVAVQNKTTNKRTATDPKTHSDNIVRRIDINNTGDGNVYGIYGKNYNAYVSARATATASATATQNNLNITTNAEATATATSTINLQSHARIGIFNNGNGNIYGMYGDTLYNAKAIARASANATAKIKYYYAEHVAATATATAKSTAYAEGTIYINNNGNGNTYGMFGNSSVYSAQYTAYDPTKSATCYSTYLSGSGTTTTGCNDVISYGVRKATADATTSANASSYIRIVNRGLGHSYGMYAPQVFNNTTNSEITITNIEDGISIGMYGTGQVENTGNIKIHNLADGTAVGMMTDSGTVTNSGTITIDRESFTDNMGTPDDTSDDVIYTAASATGGSAIGIYGGAGSSITNTGTITINGAANAYGIYSEGSTVTNNGTIIIDGNSNHANKIVLNGGELFQNGTLIVNATPQSLSLNSVSPASITLQTESLDSLSTVSYTPVQQTTNLNNVIETPTVQATSLNNVLETPAQQQASLNLNDFGGTVIASATSQFVVEGAISGDLAINNNVVTSGFDKVYTVSDMIQASDTSGLNLISQSALFDASLENGTDVVMTMKSFDTVTDNSSLAAFLEKNYASANNETFFNDIKGIGNVSALKSAMNSLTGQDTIARFGYEDLTAMRELNLQMNDKMFANDDKQIFEKQGSVNGFSFKNDNHSSANYALGTKRIAPRWKVGYAMSNTTINTDDNHDTTRHNQVFQVFAPIGYENSGIKLISTPQIGFARGHYTRKGFNDTSYYGVIEKRIFALMNEARYPMEVSGFEIAPTVEFNAIAYNQNGSEGNKAYSLKMPSDNNLSVEAGLGLYANKTIGNMKFNAGLMMYREFADPYNIKMSMNGMEGTFNLYDDTQEYRGVASFGFNYDLNDWDVYGKVQHFMESDNHTNMKAGIKYSF